MSKKSRFRGHFERQHGKRIQTLFKSVRQILYHIYWSVSRHLSWKKSLLLTRQTLGLLLNTLASDGKYPVLNRDNLTRPIQMQLSHKQKTLSQFFAPFLKSSLNFKYFFKKDDLQRFCISETTDSVNVVREMSKKSNFRGWFKKQHGKRAQVLLKSAWQCLFHIHWSL